MANIVLLNNQTHRDIRVEAGASAEHGDNQRFVQVSVTEFPRLAVHYPIFFSKDADTGQFYCGAMLGFDVGENLFLSEGGKGQDAYRPLNLQRGPFFVSGNDLAVDLDNPRVGQAKGEALFNDGGEPTPYLQGIIRAFQELRPGFEMTKAFADTLMTLKLIEPISIDVGFDDGSKRQINGLYSIARDVLRDLPDATVVDLFRRGYLSLIYAMLLSLNQVPVLAQKKNRRLHEATG
ncbi:MAG TPA: SapC family protein [Rhizomicrobium sp.]|nr:SapC family protein [Rhizomicrobium sp.]